MFYKIAGVKQKDITDFLNDRLKVFSFEGSDIALNGLQVESGSEDITTVAFAVDASLPVIERAAALGAQLLCVHHGLFWGESSPVIGAHKKRLHELFQRNIGLYGVHLPLDSDQELGTSVSLARELGVQELSPFAFANGQPLGVLGQVNCSLSDLIVSSPIPAPGWHVLPFGPEEIHSVAVVAGSGRAFFSDALRAHADLFITGSYAHEIYSLALDEAVNVAFLGHYQSEVFGVKALQRELKSVFSLNTVFIDFPLGL